MKSYFKYWPLIFTFFRAKNKNIIQWIWSFVSIFFYSIWLGILTLIYLFIVHYISFSSLLWHTALYSIIYIIFLVFYEIGYIYNDIWTTRKEKNPTLRIKEKFSDKFWINQIIIRLLIWSLVLFQLYNYNQFIWLSLFWIILILWIIYFIHNKIRNLKINFFTLFFLWLNKFWVTLLIIHIIDIDFEVKKQIIIWITTAFLFMTFRNLFIWYNEKSWGTNYIEISTINLFLVLSQLLLFAVSRNYIYIVNCLFFLVSFLNMYKIGYFRLN
jgi:hypothetical protein